MLLVELLCAEGEGFKPPIPERGIPDFESSAIDHSANLPIIQILKTLVWTFADAKVAHFSDSTKFIRKKVSRDGFLAVRLRSCGCLI